MSRTARRMSRAEAAVKREQALDYWRAGKTQLWISDTLGVSQAAVCKWVKGVAQDFVPIINAQVDVKKELLQLSDNQRIIINKEVDERMRYITFFNEAAIKNVTAAVSKIGDATTQVEHRLLAETILKGRETVLGKTPDTAVQVVNQLGSQGPLFTHPEEFKQAGRELLDAIG